MRAALTGSSGFIGTALAAALRADGHQVVRLVRRTASQADEVTWDPRATGAAFGPAALDGVDAVIHLAGAPIADHRWTTAYKAEIRNSRVEGTRALVRGLAALPKPPAVLLSGSAIGWYGDTGGREVDESAPSGTGFLPGVVREWEAAAGAASEAGIRVVTLRTGIVLSPAGGVLGKLLPLFRFGLGARLGPGTQVMSWITLSDMVGAVRFLLSHQEVSGPVNMTSPAAVTNAEFTAGLAAAVHRPAVMAIPVPALKIMLGGVSADLLSSARVLPARLATAGYQHSHPGLRDALAAELGGGAGTR